MKIGIDLDGVIFDSEKLYRVCTELYEVLDLKKNTIKDNKSRLFEERYGWNEEETKRFIDKYHEYIVENSNFMPGAKEVLKRLKEEANELIIITARGQQENKYIKITERIFKENNFEIFDKYYWGVLDKVKVCKDENIDLMIDDYNRNCEQLSKAKIKTIYLKDAPSYEIEDTEYIKTLYNWGEVYRYIKENENGRNKNIRSN